MKLFSQIPYAPKFEIMTLIVLSSLCTSMKVFFTLYSNLYIPIPHPPQAQTQTKRGF